MPRKHPRFPSTPRKRKQQVEKVDKVRIILKACREGATFREAGLLAGYKETSAESMACRIWHESMRDLADEVRDEERTLHKQQLRQLRSSVAPIAHGHVVSKSMTQHQACDVFLKTTADLNKLGDLYAPVKTETKHEITSFVHEDLVAKLNNLVRDEEDSEAGGEEATAEEPTTDTDEPSSADEPGATLGTRVP